MADPIEDTLQATPPVDQTQLFAEAASGQAVPQPVATPAPVQQQVSTQIPEFVSWDSYKQNPQFSSLSQGQKQQLFDSWHSYATDYASKTGALSTEDDVKFTEDYLTKLAKENGLQAPRFEAPNYFQQLLEEGQSGLNSLQSGVVAYGALTDNADPMAAAKIIAKNNIADQQKYVNPNLRKYMESNPDAVSAAGQMLAHPIDIMLPLFAQGIGTSLPSLAASFATGAATTALAAETGPGAPVAGLGAGLYTRAGLAGVTDVLATTTQRVNEEMQKRGLDPTDEQAVASVLNDPKFKVDTLAYTTGRGIAITATDLATLGLGEFLGPAAKAGAVAERVGAKQVVQQLGKQVGTQVVGQPVSEISAQALGQTLEGKQNIEISGRQVAERTIAGLPGNVIEGGLMTAKVLLQNNAPATANTVVRNSVIDAGQEKFGKILGEEQVAKATEIPPVLTKTTTPELPAVKISDKPSANLPPMAVESVEPKPTKETGGKDWRAKREQWDETYGRQRKGGQTHNEDGTPYQPTIFDEVMDKVNKSGIFKLGDDQRLKALGDTTLFVGQSIRDLINDGWIWDETQNKMVNPENPSETPASGLKRLSEKPTPEIPPVSKKPTSEVPPVLEKPTTEVPPVLEKPTPEVPPVLEKPTPEAPKPAEQAVTVPEVLTEEEARRKAEEAFKPVVPEAPVVSPETKVTLAETAPATAREVETQKVVAPVAETPAPAPVVTSLPKDLQGAKPRYSYGSNQFELKFNNDLDKSFYILAQEKPSKREADYMAFAKAATGMNEAEVRLAGKRIRESIKNLAKVSEPGVLEVPKSSFSERRPTVAPVAPPKVEAPAVALAPVPVAEIPTSVPIAKAPTPQGITVTQNPDGTWGFKWEHKRFGTTREGIEEETKSYSKNGFATKEEALKQAKEGRQASMQEQIRQAENLATSLEKRNNEGKDDARASRKARKAAEENKKLYDQEYPTAQTTTTPKALPPTKRQATALAKLGYLPEDLATLDRNQAKDIIAKKTPKVPVEKATEVKAEVPAPGEAGPAQTRGAVGEVSRPLVSPEDEGVTVKPVSLQEGLDSADKELQGRLDKIKGQVPEMGVDDKSVSEYYGGKIDAAKEQEVRALLKVLQLGLGNVKQIFENAKGQGRKLKDTFTGIKKVVFTKAQKGGSGIYVDPSDIDNIDTLYVNPDQLLRTFKAQGVLDPAHFFVSALTEEVIHANHGLALVRAFRGTNPPELTAEAFRKFYDAQNKEIENSLSVNQIKKVLDKYADSLGINLEGKSKEQILNEFNQGRPGRAAEEYLRALIQEKVLGHITEDQVKMYATNPVLRSLAAIKNFFIELVGNVPEYNKTEIDKQQKAILDIIKYTPTEQLNVAKTEKGTVIPSRILASAINPFAEEESRNFSKQRETLARELERNPEWRDILLNRLRGDFPTLPYEQLKDILQNASARGLNTFDESAGAKLTTWIYKNAYREALSERLAIQKEQATGLQRGARTLTDLATEREKMANGAKGFENNPDLGFVAPGETLTTAEEGIVNAPQEPVGSLESLTATRETPATQAVTQEKYDLVKKLEDRFFRPGDKDIIKYIQGTSDKTREQISEEYGFSNNAFTKRRDQILQQMRDILSTKEFGSVKSYREMASSVEPRTSEALKRYKENLPEEIKTKLTEYSYIPKVNDVILKDANAYVNFNSYANDPMEAYYSAKTDKKVAEYRTVINRVVIDRLSETASKVAKEIREKGTTPETKAYLDDLYSNIALVTRDTEEAVSNMGRDLQLVNVVNGTKSPKTFEDEYVKPIAKAQKELLGGKQEVASIEKDIKAIQEELATKALEGVEQIATGGKTAVTGDTPMDILFKKVLDFKEDLKKDMTDPGASATSIRVKFKETFPEFSDAQAESLSKYIASRFKKLAQGKDVQGKLEELVSKVGTKASKPDSEEIRTLQKMVDLGGFDQEQLYNLLASRYELPKWDPVISKEILNRALALRELEEGSDQRLSRGNDLQMFIAQELHKQQKGWDKFNYRLDVASSLWKAGVLSGIPTQLVNFSGTHMNVLLDMLEDATAYSLSAEKKLGVKVPIQDFLTDAWRGYFQAAGREGLQNAGLALASGVTRYKNEGKFRVSPLEMYKFDFSKPWKPTNYLAAWKLVGRAMAATDGYNAGISAEVKARMAARYAMIADGLTPKQAAEKSDAIFSQSSPELIEIRNKVNKEQLDGQFGTLEGLKPGSLDYNSKRRIIEAGASRRYQQLRDKYIAESTGIGEKGIEAAKEFAREATFNNDPKGLIGYLASNIGRTLSSTPLGVPFGSFMGTVSNIVNSSLNYTPYGFLRAKGFSLGNFSGAIKEGTHGFKAPEPGSVAYYKLATQAWMGTVALGTIGAMVFKDMDKPWDKAAFAVTGRGPADPNKKQQLKDSGWTENTVKIGDFTFRHTDIPALSVLFGALGFLSDQKRYGNMKDEDFVTLASTIPVALGNVVFDKNLMSGAKTIFDTFSEQGDTKKKAQRLLESYATGFTNPGITRWLTQTFMIGPDGKVGKTDMKDLKTTTGGWLMSLFPTATIAGKPQLNRLGEEIREYPWAATTKRFGFVPEIKTHPVFTPLVKADLYVPGVSAASKINAFENGKAVQRKLDATEYYDFAKFNGEYLRRSLTPSVAESLARLAQSDHNAAQKELNRMASDANDYAKARLEAQLRARRK